MQLPLTAVRAGEVTTAMREKLQTVDGGTWILVQPLFFYESLWCLLVLLGAYDAASTKKYSRERYF